MGCNLKGEAELAAWLKTLPEEVATKAAQDGLRKSAARLRTLIRRAAPIKTGRLRNAIQSRVSKKRTFAWVGVKKPRGGKTAPNFYATLEKGRKAHSRKGRPVKASPQMARFAFFKKAWTANQQNIKQLMIEATRAGIVKRSIQSAAKVRTRIRAR